MNDHQVLPYCVQLRRGMVYEASVACSMSVTYDGAVLTVVAQTSYFVSASYFDRKPMK